MPFFNHSIFAHISNSYNRHKKLLFWSLGSTVVIVGLLAGGIFAYTKIYEGRIYPNVMVAGINLGGLTQEEATDVLQSKFNHILDSGLTLVLDGEEKTTDLRASGSTDPDLVYNYIDFDVHKAVNDSLAVGRTNGNIPAALWTLVSPYHIETQITFLETEIALDIHNAFSEMEDPGVPTDFKIEIGRNETTIEIIEGATGREIDTDAALKDLEKDMDDLKLEKLQLVIADSEEIISEEEALSLESEIRQIIDAAPYRLTHLSDAQKEFDWKIEDKDIADWLIPVREKDGSITLDLTGKKLNEFFDNIHETVDVKPQNARFNIEDSKVVEFAGSLNGEILNEEATLAELKSILGDSDMSIAITVDVDVPEITTGSVNNFGITEILGVGVSDFSGSPSNRIANIKNGASKLNGILVAPGETISLIEELRPFTYENGYLPELVIKGDEIKPEIGGGLCQIGTTTFRAVMNSGLEVTERRNHSLVVSYYDDMTNGKPGTDATIYEPAPDFKFTNNYENYVLFITEVDMTDRLLYFTFWGTNDGRNAYYTPPVVLSWTGYGATKTTETDSLPPGVKRCQSPHPGANTTFDYIIEYADGTEKIETFNSTYRSLPMICLVGKEEGSGDTEVPAEVPSELEVGDVVE
ncbi:VanW family protein [Patescibacteria group bacterium]|nr:VanW family protein [Patescibacteria group bacterium]